MWITILNIIFILQFFIIVFRLCTDALSQHASYPTRIYLKTMEPYWKSLSKKTADVIVWLGRRLRHEAWYRRRLLDFFLVLNSVARLKNDRYHGQTRRSCRDWGRSWRLKFRKSSSENHSLNKRQDLKESPFATKVGACWLNKNFLREKSGEWSPSTG